MFDNSKPFTCTLQYILLGVQNIRSNLKVDLFTKSMIYTLLVYIDDESCVVVKTLDEQ